MKKKQPASEPTDSILESISDGVFTVDHDWRVTSFNRAAESITGIPRAEAIGRLCSEVFRASMCEADCALRHTMKTGRPVINRACYIVNADGRRVPISVSTALLRDGGGRIIGGAETFRDLSVVEELRKELAGRYELGDIVSRSPAMRRLMDVLPQVAASTSTVLIQGETGTGKELLARALHNLSPRNKGPFVTLNCGALPDTLLESEMFGYRAGAFTGAERDKPGRFARAEKGTLFLDEIGDMSPALQVRLLRALQERQYEPLGAVAPVKADVRIVAASNKELAELVQAGAFRADLYYRVNVIRLELPPLRERKEDVPMLAMRFIERLNRREGRDVAGLTPEALALLMAHDFPGNIRELENIIERAFVLCGARGGFITPQCLPETLQGAARLPSHPRQRVHAMRAAEARVIQDALDATGGNKTAAARLLNMHKSTLFRKLKSLGLGEPGS